MYSPGIIFGAFPSGGEYLTVWVSTPSRPMHEYLVPGARAFDTNVYAPGLEISCKRPARGARFLGGYARASILTTP